MKPKTKLERRIVELSEKLQPIAHKQINYAHKNCFTPVAYRTKSVSHCLECGHSFTTNNAILNCPLCGVKLNYTDTRKRQVSEQQYFCIVNKVQDMLVLRMFIIYKHSKVSSPPRHVIVEVVQNWIDSTSHYKVMARKARFMCSYGEWDLGSKIEIRNPRDSYTRNEASKYIINPIAVYPHKCTLPILTRNGFKGDFHSIAPVSFIRQLIYNPQFETLLKAKQYDLLRRNHNGFPLIIWQAIRICIRNNYIVKDAIMWRDYIDKLIDFNKDVRNAKYVCPIDLRAEHDKLLAKERVISERLRAEGLRRKHEQDLKDIKEAETMYQQQKKRFMDILISDGELEISPLQSVEEFKKEGDTLRHCVFSNRYYKKENSLILSAHKGNEKIETIEISLNDLQIIQCHGAQNKSTKYHDQIINLINKNIHQIRQRTQKQ